MTNSLAGIGAIVVIWLSSVVWIVIMTLRVVNLERRLRELTESYTNKGKDSSDTANVK